MFRPEKSDLNANSRERKGSTDIDTLDGIEHTEKLYMPIANRGKRNSGWSSALTKEKSPKTSAAQQSSGKSSGADSAVLLSDDENDIDDYVADISDVTSSIVHPGKIFHDVINEADPRINFSSLSIVDDIDLSILTKHLHPLEDVLEKESQVWTWDSLFTKVASELRSEGKYK